MEHADTAEPRFAVCIRNEGYPASLELRKIYELRHDPAAERDGFVRVVDESGEDYLFPASHFVAVEFPAAVEEALLRAS